MIVELRFASRETVEQTVRAARSPGSTVARVLVEMGALTEEQLARATAERYGIDYVDLGGFEVDPAAANLIKPSAARRYRAVPIAHVGKRLLVAMADPADALGVNDIALMTKLEVRPATGRRPLRAAPRHERDELRAELLRVRAEAEVRAKQARQALCEMRDEAERERERAAMTERELREQLGDEERRRSDLESRLSEVEGAAFAAERAFEELRLAQGRMRGALRALAGGQTPPTAAGSSGRAARTP